MNSKGDLFLCDFGNSLNKKTKPNWKKLNFGASDTYSSPEQFNLKALQDNKKLWGKLASFKFEKIDCYSLGLILFVLIFNSFPF